MFRAARDGWFLIISFLGSVIRKVDLERNEVVRIHSLCCCSELGMIFYGIMTCM